MPIPKTITAYTLADLLAFRDEIIKRNAMSILKRLQKLDLDSLPKHDEPLIKRMPR